MTARIEHTAEPPQSAIQPLVSVVIDNYNYAAFLPAAIESALCQDYERVELVVVDDGSTDNSRAIIENYGSQLKPAYKSNGGQASALNAGFSACQGDFILFLDADDILLPAAISHVVHAFDHSTIVNVHWPMWVLDAKGNRTGEMKPSQAPAEGDFREQLLARGPGNVPSAPTSGNAWSRRYLEQILPIPENVRYYHSCADEYLFTLAPAFGHVRTIREPQSCYRIHGGNVYSSKSFGEKLQLELEHYDEHCRAVSAALTRKDVPVDTTRWKQHSWFHRLDDAVADIIRIVPEHATVALVDGNTWDAPRAFGTRRLVPFMQQDGVDWGPPADGETAIAQLDELLSEQTQFLAVGWPCFWWFDEYPEFFKVLGRHSICRVRNDAVVIYELAPRTVATNGASVPLNGNAEVDRYV